MGEAGECAELMVGKTTLDRISMRVIAIVCIMHLSNIVIRTETLGGMYAKGKPSLEREVLAKPSTLNPKPQTLDEADSP